MTQASTNGGLHHERDQVHVSRDEDPVSPPPDTLTLEGVARALSGHADETRRQYNSLAKTSQGLRDDVSALSRKTDVVLTIAGQTSAKVDALDSKVEAVIRAVTDQQRASLTTEAQQDAEIAKTKALATKAQALAVVRKGAFALGVAAGTALALEWRWAFKTLVSLFGG